MYWLRGLALRRATPIARNPRTASRFKGHFHTPRNLHHIAQTSDARYGGWRGAGTQTSQGAKESIKESEGMGASVLFFQRRTFLQQQKKNSTVKNKAGAIFVNPPKNNQKYKVVKN